MAKTPIKPVRIADELWDAAGRAAARSEPPADRSTLIRDFFAWYTRAPGSKMPKRPPAVDETGASREPAPDR